MVTGWYKLKVGDWVETLVKHSFSNEFYFSFVRPDRFP